MAKASLNLSVNAIVVLIIAITMLGLALGFIRGMFGKMTLQMEEKISEEQEPPTPTASDPISISRDYIKTYAGEHEVIKVAVYNPTSSRMNDVNPIVKCKDIVSKGSTTQISTSNPRSIEVGEIKKFNVILDIPDTSPPGIYLCRLEISNLPSKDLTIEVTS